MKSKIDLRKLGDTKGNSLKSLKKKFILFPLVYYPFCTFKDSLPTPPLLCWFFVFLLSGRVQGSIS